MTQLSLTQNRWAIGTGLPLAVIAGCNVLESREESFEICKTLKQACEDLSLPFVFKASFDKANRSSVTSYRGMGVEQGLALLAEIKAEFDVPICTDLHSPEQAESVAKVADIIQIPAFLCRQTDLVVTAAKAADKAGALLQVKKGQFLAPWDCKNIITNIQEVTSRELTILCERGVSFGYNNLVVDPLAISEMKKLGVPVTIDATHAVQLPGADPRTGGASTGGRRDGVALIAKACVAVGADGVFLEFHTDPDAALCDAPSCLPIGVAKGLLSELKAIRAIVNSA